MDHSVSVTVAATAPQLWRVGQISQIPLQLTKRLQGKLAVGQQNTISFKFQIYAWKPVEGQAGKGMCQ